MFYGVAGEQGAGKGAVIGCVRRTTTMTGGLTVLTDLWSVCQQKEQRMGSRPVMWACGQDVENERIFDTIPC